MRAAGLAPGPDTKQERGAVAFHGKYWCRRSAFGLVGHLLGAQPGAAMTSLAGLVAASGLAEDERAALVRGDPVTLDALARTLNELRTIPGRPP